VSVLLALAASVSWGVSDFLGGLNSRSLAVASVMLISQTVGLGLLLPLALVGIVLASRASNDSGNSEGKLANGVGFAALAALGFGGFFVLIHQASAYDVLWAGAIQRLTGVCIMVVVVLALRPSLKIGWPRVPALLVIGTLDTGANVLYGAASTMGLVSVSAVLASLYPVMTVVLARFVLRERLSPSQGTGVVCA